MGSKRTIDQWSLKYWAIKYLWAKQTFKLYYRKLELHNVKIISRNRPVILAPNHQNALMDALSIVIQVPFQTIFMARADIFKKPFFIKILTILKISPIYRIRDGISSLSKNEEVFDETTRILRNHYNPLCLFPEGNHGDKRRLRPLVKGIFRIALKAQSEYKDKPGIQIIPVGIDYKHYQKFRQTLFVNFGEPIEVSEYWSQYEENPAVAVNALRERLATEMRKYMIDIQTEEYYDTYMELREVYRPEMYKRLGAKSDSLYDRFKADKELISKLDKTLESNPDKIGAIDSKFKRYAEIRDKLNFRNWTFKRTNYSILLNILQIVALVVLSPLFLFGLFNNWPHYYFPMKFSKKIKDPQFRSTATWGMGVVIQAIYYIILITLAFIFSPIWWLAFIYVVVLPYSGLLAWWMRKIFIKAIARLRFKFALKKSAELQEAIQLRADIINDLNSIV